MKLNKYTVGIGVIIMAIIYRFLPHPPNFSPVNAIFLFAGATLVKRYSSLIGILALVILSDFILNNTLLRAFYPEINGIVWFGSYMLFNVISFVAIFLIGVLIKSKKSILSIAGGSIVASSLFFLFTNTGSWVFDFMNIYSNNVAGWMTCMGAGIPFYGNTVASDLMFSGIIFGLHHLAVNTFVAKPALTV